MIPDRRYFAWKLLVYFIFIWPWFINYNPLQPNNPYYAYDLVSYRKPLVFLGYEPVQDMILTIIGLMVVALLRRTYLRLMLATETLKNLTEEQKRDYLGK